jgi:hypothetical protein
MLKSAGILSLIIAAMFFALPVWAVTGEVNVTAGGQAVPGAQVTLDYGDSKVKAKPDPKRDGTYVFDVTEQQAAKPAKLIVEKDGKTTTEEIKPINECATVEVGGKKRCVVELVIELAPLIDLGIKLHQGFGGFGGGM